ncbi:MAG: bacterial transcriptional activator domain-containing protein [candidate division WOR-3 bacterium]
MNLRDFQEKLNPLLTQERLSDALMFCREVYESTSLHEVRARAIFWIGRLLFRLGYHPELGELIRENCDEIEDQPSPYFRIRALELEMEYFLDIGEPKKARAILKKLRSFDTKNDPGVTALRDMVIGIYYVKTGDFVRAEEIFEELYSRLKKSGKWLKGGNEAFFLCLSKLFRGDIEGFSKLLSQEATDIPTWIDLHATGLIIMGKPADSIPLLNGLLSRFRGEDSNKGISSAAFSLGVAWAALGDLEKALLYADVSLLYGRNIPRYLAESEVLKIALSPSSSSLVEDLRKHIEQSYRKGFIRAWVYANYTLADALLNNGDKGGAMEIITRLTEYADYGGRWGFIYLMAQMKPEPLRIARKMFPQLRSLKEVPDYIVGLRKAIPVVHVRFLDGCRIRGPDGEILVNQKRDAEILALMATERRNPRTKEQLAGIVWPKSPSSKAMRNLYNSLSRIKSYMRSVGIKLPPSRFKGPGKLPVNFRLDTEEFESMVSTGRVLSRTGEPERALIFYEKALEMYGGDFLPNSKAHWAEELRELYRRMFMEALIFLSRYYLEDSPEKSLKYAQAALSADPLSEDACGLALKAMIVLKRLPEAKKLYERFVENYRRTIEMEPDLKWPPR